MHGVVGRVDGGPVHPTWVSGCIAYAVMVPHHPQCDIREVSNHRVGGVAANPTNFDGDETSCGAKLIASASNFKTP